MKAILGASAVIAAASMVAFAQTRTLPPPVELAAANAMNNPYRMLEAWPHLWARGYAYLD